MPSKVVGDGKSSACLQSQLTERLKFPSASLHRNGPPETPRKALQTYAFPLPAISLTPLCPRHHHPEPTDSTSGLPLPFPLFPVFPVSF